MNVSPAQVLDALRESVALLDPVLAGRFQPAREQLHLATTLTLNEAYYHVREAETQALFGIYRAEVAALSSTIFCTALSAYLRPPLALGRDELWCCPDRQRGSSPSPSISSAEART